MTGALWRGFRNPFRSVTRALVVVSLLALVIGFLALLLQATRTSREQIAAMEGKVRTLIELREAGAFGTGGFGGDKPLGEGHFSTGTFAKIRQVPNAHHIVRMEEYVNQPQIDPSKKNAYAMVIGLKAGSAMRAIGEVDYESAHLIAGRALSEADRASRVAVVGQLYAKQRLAINTPTGADLAGKQIILEGQPFNVVGVYATGNDFGDNHVFVPIEAFRVTFRPGAKLSKIFLTVDSVANVEAVLADLKAALPEADVVTTPEAVSTARTTLGTLAVASLYAAILLFAIGAVLIVAVMILSTRERVREIGTLKAIGASNREIVVQFLAEAGTLSGLGSVGAIVVAALLAHVLSQAFGFSIAFDGTVVALILLGAVVFAALGSLYPVVRGVTLSPVEAMRRG